MPESGFGPTGLDHLRAVCGERQSLRSPRDECAVPSATSDVEIAVCEKAGYEAKHRHGAHAIQHFGALPRGRMHRLRHPRRGPAQIAPRASIYLGVRT